MNTEFYVYINEPNNKALIHEAECSYCNHGEGLTSMKSNNGTWVGPLKKSRAIVKATQSGKNRVQWCAYCAKRLRISVDDV